MNKNILPPPWLAYAGDGRGNARLEESPNNYYLVRYPTLNSPPVEVFSRIELKDGQEVMVGYNQPYLLEVIKLNE